MSRACELAIAARIRGHAAGVIAAIALDPKAQAARVEVCDEAEQRNLPPKGDSEPTRAQRAPATSRFLRWLDHRRTGRPDQGHPGSMGWWASRPSVHLFTAKPAGT